MAWAMQRGLALALLCAPACARGVSLEGSDPGETLAMTDGGSTAVTVPTESPGDTTSPTTTMEAEGSTSTGDLPTDATEESSGGEESSTGPELPHPELYPFDRVHSPITAYVAEQMRAIAPQPDTVNTTFAKIGGTTTASANFMQCLADDAAIMELPPELLATRDFFNVDLGAGITSFTRDSAAAMPAWTSDDLFAGPVADELSMIHPRFAHVLVGTHDLASDQPAAMFAFAENMFVILKDLLAAGTVPILSTLPQRTDMPIKAPYIPRYNALIRGFAQGHQIPLVDLELALQGVPMAGVGPDGIDLTAFVSAMVDRPCFFDEVGLQSGYNVRNLESLVALDRARRVVVLDEAELDAPQPGLRGSGTLDDPFEIPGLPFVDMRSTAGAASNVVPSYSGVCDMMQDESGPEVVYHLEVDSLVNLRVLVFDPVGVDVDIHVLDSPDPTTCLKRDDKEIAGPLPDGDYTIIVDTFAGDVPGGAPGDYVLVVLAD
jgi:hypothetical protein